jgi:hypothetical protein
LPGYSSVKRAERLAFGTQEGGRQIFGAAFVEEGVARLLAREAVGDREAEIDEQTLKRFWPVTTSESIAASLRTVWKERLEKWGLGAP